MADDVKDIAIYTGSEWTSLSELTAGVVDVNLPIESVDGTVVVDGASSVFTVSTGGETAIHANQYQTVGIGTTASRSTVLHAKGTPNRDLSTGVLSDLSATVSKGDAFGYFQQFTVDDAATVIGEFKSYFSKGLYGAGSVTNYIGYQCEPIASGADNVTAFRSRVNVSSTGGTNYAFYSEGSALSYFNGGIKTISVLGLSDNDASVTLGNQATLKKGDGSEYVPTDSASIATKKIVDDKIWVGTTAAYNQISPKLAGTLYCLTD